MITFPEFGQATPDSVSSRPVYRTMVLTTLMAKFKAVLFDLDGTLLDTLEDIAGSANRVLASRGFPVRPLDVHRVAVGDGARKMMERVLPEAHRTPEMIEECFVAFRRDYGEHWNVKSTRLRASRRCWTVCNCRD